MMSGTTGVARAFLGVALVTIACGSDRPQTGSQQGTAQSDGAAAPELGKADSPDSADHDCRVVLATADAGDCYRSDCSIRGTIDVRSDDSRPATAHVLFQSRLTTSNWDSVQATVTDGGPDGFLRYSFVFSYPTTWPSREEFVPYLQIDGSRLFDHNRTAGNYDLGKEYADRHIATDAAWEACTQGDPAAGAPSSGGKI